MKNLIIISVIFMIANAGMKLDLRFEGGYRYEIRVELANSTFNDVDGILYLFINDDFIRLNRSILKVNEIYSSEHLLNFLIDNIRNVSFYWELGSSYKNMSKSKINLNQVKLYPLYVKNDPDYAIKNVKIYCLKSLLNSIEQLQKTNLDLCNIGDSNYL